MSSTGLSEHLREVLEKQIPKNGWFTKDDVILIRRSGWVLSQLVIAGILERDFKGDEIKYKVIDGIKI